MTGEGVQERETLLRLIVWSSFSRQIEVLKRLSKGTQK
jgi:hypothetical protein